MAYNVQRYLYNQKKCRQTTAIPVKSSELEPCNTSACALFYTYTVIDCKYLLTVTMTVYQKQQLGLKMQKMVVLFAGKSAV